MPSFLFRFHTTSRIDFHSKCAISEIAFETLPNDAKKRVLLHVSDLVRSMTELDMNVDAIFCFSLFAL